MNAPSELRGAVFPLILAAPSGAGKTSIARALAQRRGDVEFSVSCTTRPPRAHELDGADYHFRTRDEFHAMVAAGELLEWAEVHGHFYGTPRVNLELARARRHFLLLDIDVEGSRQVKRAVPEAVSIFVLPPSAGELQRRLAARGSETPEIRRQRLMAARAELAAAVEFDYLVINDSLASSVTDVEGIMNAETRRTVRLDDLRSVVDGLVRGVDQVLHG